MKLGVTPGGTVARDGRPGTGEPRRTSGTEAGEAAEGRLAARQVDPVDRQDQRGSLRSMGQSDGVEATDDDLGGARPSATVLPPLRVLPAHLRGHADRGSPTPRRHAPRRSWAVPASPGDLPIPR